MSGNLNLIRSVREDASLAYSETVFENDLTIESGFSGSLSGPLTVPNVTVEGNLNVLTEINITGNLTIGANGQMNIIG